MAAQSKTTAVHFSLIFFVMLSVILGVVAYLFHSDYSEQQATFTKNQQELGTEKGLTKKYSDEIDALKKKLGLEQQEVGVAVPGDNTVLSQADAAIRTFGTNPSSPSLFAAIKDLRTEYDKRGVEIASRQQTIAELQAQVEALKGQYETTAKEHDGRRQATETDLSGQQQTFAETVVARDKDISDLRERNVALETELAQSKEQLNAAIAQLKNDMRSLEQTNIRLNRDLDKIKGESFEVADGQIRRVDQVSRLVWLNLGSADNLRPRTTFSVYARNNSGIGREGSDGGRPEDIKGSIEVVRIIEDHLAEARILDDDSSRPISPGDPIYSPLWNRGRVEQFAFVGMIDIDNDKSYVGDRERLHEIVESAGAKVAVEVNNEGVRVPEGRRIDEQIRFLVVSPIPDPMGVPAGERREQLKQMGQHRTEMEDEARRSGVKVVNLNTFLDYVGFIPQQRRWVPGENKDWTLQDGSRRTGEQPVSGGNTSGLFSKDRLKANRSGRTSQTFPGSGN